MTARPLLGRASAVGTMRYARRVRDASADYFSVLDGLTLTSLAHGTYLGAEDQITDEMYYDAAMMSLSLGCNVFDTAPNYRNQRSERIVGMALRESARLGITQRDEVCVQTKVGYIPFGSDWTVQEKVRFVRDQLVGPGIASMREVEHGHLLSPAYLKHSVKQSLDNLGLECIDICYLHNPDVQARWMGADGLRIALRGCFEQLETLVDSGCIQGYGIASWEGFTSNPVTLDIDTLVDLATSIAGTRHHLKTIQTPINLLSCVAADIPWRSAPADRAAARGLGVFASSALSRGRLKRLPLEVRNLLPEMDTDSQRALQYARSVHGVTSAIVGMSSQEHVVSNLQLRSHARMSESECQRLLS